MFQLLCEVEWALLSLAIPLPGAVPRDIMSPDERNLSDDTDREIRDWGVLIKYRDFLHGWADVIARAASNRHGYEEERGERGRDELHAPRRPRRPRRTVAELADPADHLTDHLGARWRWFPDRRR